jgi:phosphonate transport system ATP-binding protein
MLQLFRDADIEIALDALRQVELEHKAQMREISCRAASSSASASPRALAQRPAVILADEPVASLDPKTSRVVLGFLQRICKRPAFR